MKTLLVGLNNPLSPRPSHALLYYPVGSTGHRLLELIRGVDPSFDADDYLDAFERLNLWPGRELPEGRGSTALLQAEGRRVLKRATAEPRDVVLLGTKVWYCVLNRQPTMTPWLGSVEVGGSRFHKLPHPSGLCREYNDDELRRRAGELLLGLAREEVTHG